MHIEVTRGLNQLGANRNKKYGPEEIDVVLNKMYDRFIRSCLKSKDNGGFEIDQVKADDLQPLIVSNASLVPYIVDDTRYKAYLPYDYKYLLSDSSYAVDLTCGNTPIRTSKTVVLTALRQDKSAKSTPKWYATNVVVLGGVTVSIPTDLPYGYTYDGYNSKNDIVFLSPYLALRGGWYWERVGNYYYPGHYIRLSSESYTGTNKVSVDGTDYTTVVVKNLTEEIYTNPGTLTNNRLTATNLISGLLGDAIYGTKVYSPISEISGNILYVYQDTNFIISGVSVSYIRKPQPISLSLNTSCELSDAPAQIICDWAVEHIKGRLENTTGQQLAERDIDRRVTL